GVSEHSFTFGHYTFGVLTRFFILHLADALVPVTIVQLGDPVTLKCFFPEEKKTSSSELHWYKQSAGNSLELIVKLLENTTPTYGPKYLGSRLTATYSEKISNLTIMKTTEEDEGMYHCSVIDWNKNIWQGTYLLIKGNTVVSSNYTVVQTPTISHPVHPGDPVTLQCSVLSSSDSKKCSGDLNLFWIRAGDKSLPNIIYTDGNRENKCEEKLDSQQRCVYNFSKTVNASDATFYCAVATCGEIFFGNGTQLDNQQPVIESINPKNNALVITMTCFVISVIVNVILICYRTPKAACKQDNDNENLDYAALQFSGRKSTRGMKKKQLKTEEDVYAQVKV
uniref:Ig-like domain-containing protein n=1 Tax=Poecilia latipinna TaxID=48699 RepID=A0A3B3THX9_9TELE